MIGRRSFITGLVSLVAAPAIVRAGSLMPVQVMIEAPSMTQMLIRHAEWLANPPLMEWIDMDAVMAEMVRINRVPERWLR